jgi:hypothetical protein
MSFQIIRETAMTTQLRRNGPEELMNMEGMKVYKSEETFLFSNACKQTLEAGEDRRWRTDDTVAQCTEVDFSRQRCDVGKVLFS